RHAGRRTTQELRGRAGGAQTQGARHFCLSDGAGCERDRGRRLQEIAPIKLVRSSNNWFDGASRGCSDPASPAAWQPMRWGPHRSPTHKGRLMTKFVVNGKEFETSDPADMPLLWALRDRLKMHGTKYGCGIGACGACTVMIDGQAMRSCQIPIANVEGKSVTTIEGLAPADAPTPVQAAWIAEQVPQCGYCQSGMIMAATALLAAKPNPT